MANITAKKAVQLPPKILLCKCQHEYQDKKFGKGMRFHNHSPIKKKGFYCIVCLRINELT